MISLKVEEGPDRVGRSVGLFSRIHWRVEVGRGILNYQSAEARFKRLRTENASKSSKRS